MTHLPIPKDYPVQPATEGRDLVTCGNCELSWDDSIVTGMTPAPSARCPFEPFHVSEEMQKFLADGDYADTDEWMADSDYDQDENGDWTYEGSPVDPEEMIAAAMEASAEEDGHGLSITDKVSIAMTRVGIDPTLGAAVLDLLEGDGELAVY